MMYCRNPDCELTVIDVDTTNHRSTIREDESVSIRCKFCGAEVK